MDEPNNSTTCMPLPTGKGVGSQELARRLVQSGLLTVEQLNAALQAGQRRGMPLSAYLVQMGLVEEEQLAACISESFGVPLLEKSALDEVARDALARLPPELAERHRLLPLKVKGNELQVCLSDPQFLEELEDLERAIGHVLQPCVVTETALCDALEEHYGIRPEVRLFSGKAPPPSHHSLKRTKAGIDRTGVFHAFKPPVAGDPESPDDPDHLLASATSSNEVLRGALLYFARLFTEVAVLGIGKGKAVVLMVGNRYVLRAPAQQMGITLPEGSAVRAVLDRPHVAHYPAVTDGTIARLCRKLELPLEHLSMVPVFAHNRPAFVVIGHGLEEAQLKGRFAEIREFVTRTSEALARVAPAPGPGPH
jgi:hypothetical protein